MLFEDNNVNIYGSRDQIRTKLVEFAQQYLELQSVDLYKTSFLSYMINSLSILSADQMFFNSSIYKDFFFLTSQLPESVTNLAQWIGYTPNKAIPSTVNVLFKVPLGFQDSDVNLTIPYDYMVSAGDIDFTIDSSFNFGANISGSGDNVQTEIADMVNNNVSVRILNNRVVTVQDSNGFFYNVQLYIPTDGSDTEARFLLPFTQSTVSFNSFQIADDLEFYQFVSETISNIDGQVASQEIYVVPPNVSLPTGVNITDINSYDDFLNILTPTQRAEYLWTESTTGIYTLTQSDTQYTWSSLEGEATIIFGNGVLGQQPIPGSTVFAILNVTQGEDGNVIPGAITTGDSIYYQDGSGKTRRVKVEVINTSAAINGSNVQTIEEIKSSAITQLSSKTKLVTEGDYNVFNEIVKEVPLEGPTPILKRSDLKANEFMLFSELINTNSEGISEIVPTRNITFPVDTSSYPTLYVPGGSTPNNEFDEFETIFAMTVNPLTNTADYEYVLDSATINAALESADQNYNPSAYILIPQVSYNASVDPLTNSTTLSITADVNHIVTDEITQFRCILRTVFDGNDYSMITNLNSGDPNIIDSFTYDFVDIEDFPKGLLQFRYTIEGYIPYSLVTTEDKAALGWGATEEITQPSAWLPISVYSNSIIIRQDLREIMTSSVTVENGEYIIHNVPVILSEYLTQSTFDSSLFQTNILQGLITTININQYRMLTDYVNLKFPDTYDKLTNMKYNPLNKDNILSRSLTTIPAVPTLNDSYIVNGSEGIDGQGINWVDHINDIASWNGASWSFVTPTFDYFVKIDNPGDPDDQKQFIFTGSRWIEPIFDIPLRIHLKVKQDTTTSISSTALINNVRTALIDHFSSSFGLDKNLDKSEIVKVARDVSGVQYVELLQPQVDIRFNYDIETLTQDQLLDYTPQLVAFTEDSITVTIQN